MDFIKQYFKVIGYMLMGLVFIFSSFYLLANAYHYLEIRKDYIVDFDQLPVVDSIKKNLEDTTANINAFDPNTYTGSLPVNTMILIKENLTNCVKHFNNDTYNSLHQKTRISIIDVYKLSDSYDEQILNNCIVNNLNWVTSEKNDNLTDYLIQTKDINKMYVQSLINSISYLKKDLLNNSSYYYNTGIASSSVKDNTRDGLNEVLDAYNKASKYLLYISNWFRKEAGV